MNKKADAMLDFLLRLLLALIIFVPVGIFAAKYFVVSDDYSKSLVAITGKVEDLSKDASKTMSNVAVRVGGEGAVLFFSKDSDGIVAERFFSDEGGKSVDSINRLDSVKVLRPVDCVLGEACVCVCDSEFVDENGKTKSSDYGSGVKVMSCGGKFKCDSLASSVDVDSDFLVVFRGGMLFVPYASFADRTYEAFSFSGGSFVIPSSSNSVLFVKKEGSTFCFSDSSNLDCVA